MPYDEFLLWQKYLKKRPIGWREDLRTFYIMKSFGFEGRPESVFPSLNFSSNTDPISSLKGSVLFKKMMSAVNGDRLEL